MLSIKDKTVRVAIFISGYIIFLVVLHFTLGRWVLIENVAKEEALAEASKKKLQEDDALIKAYPNPKKKIEELKANMEELKLKSVSGKELPRVIQQLTKKSLELNIDIMSIEPKDQVEFKERALPQGVSKAYIEIIFRADYKSAGEYLKALGELPIIFTIEKFTMGRISENEDLRRRRLDEFTGRRPEEAEAQKRLEDNDKLQVELLISSYTVWEL